MRRDHLLLFVFAIGVVACRLTGSDRSPTPPASESPAPLSSTSAAPSATPTPTPSAVVRPDVSLDALVWRTVVEPFTGDLEQVVKGAFLDRQGQIVAWGRDQEWINSDWGDATTSFWTESAIDGTWSKTRIGELGTSAEAQDIADDGETFVAVGFVGGTPAAWHSMDASNWTRAAVSPESSSSVSNFGAVAAGSNGFLSVGESRRGAIAWFSTDGTEWHELPRAFPQSDLYDVVATPMGGFLVVGVDRSGRDWDAVAWTVSPDGLDWHPAEPSDALAGPDDDELYRVWAYKDGYLALGEHGDAEERLTCDAGKGLIASTGTLVGHGPCWSSVTHAYTSRDGQHWQSVRAYAELGSAAPLDFWEYRAIEPWGDGLIAVGSGTDWEVRVWLSDDGVDWAPVGDPITLEGAPMREQGQTWTVDDLLVADGRLVIGGSGPGSDGYVMIGTTPP